jgi:hypothetical protein
MSGPVYPTLAERFNVDGAQLWGRGPVAMGSTSGVESFVDVRFPYPVTLTLNFEVVPNTSVVTADNLLLVPETYSLASQMFVGGGLAAAEPQPVPLGQTVLTTTRLTAVVRGSSGLSSARVWLWAAMGAADLRGNPTRASQGFTLAANGAVGIILPLRADMRSFTLFNGSTVAFNFALLPAIPSPLAMPATSLSLPVGAAYEPPYVDRVQGVVVAQSAAAGAGNLTGVSWVRG